MEVLITKVRKLKRSVLARITCQTSPRRCVQRPDGLIRLKCINLKLFSRGPYCLGHNFLHTLSMGSAHHVYEFCTPCLWVLHTPSMGSAHHVYGFYTPCLWVLHRLCCIPSTQFILCSLTARIKVTSIRLQNVVLPSENYQYSHTAITEHV